MLRPISLLVALEVLLAPAPLQTKDKYTIKLKGVGKGESSWVERKVEHSVTTKTEIKDMGTITDEGKSTKHDIYIETVLDRADGVAVPTKAKRVYEKAMAEGNGPLAIKGPATRPYHGKTVLIEKNAVNYEFKLEGGGVLDTDIEDLSLDFQGGGCLKVLKNLLPGRPVAVDETWKVDGKDIHVDRRSVADFHVVKEEANAKLVKALRKDGRMWATIDVEIEVEFMSGAGKPGDGRSESFKFVTKLTFEGCIDGTKAEGRISATIHSESTSILSAQGMGSVVTRVAIIQGTLLHTWKEMPRK
ncbi:MAG TPA: hypothetical protein VE988_04415 [Gemmataceae bacterium]|nr:hypothetical protein [Gemmataceae bacterium]